MVMIVGTVGILLYLQLAELMELTVSNVSIDKSGLYKTPLLIQQGSSSTFHIDMHSFLFYALDDAVQMVLQNQRVPKKYMPCLCLVQIEILLDLD